METSSAMLHSLESRHSCHASNHYNRASLSVYPFFGSRQQKRTLLRFGVSFFDQMLHPIE
jgi:hypothetical protein